MGGTTSKEASQNESNLKSPPASLTAITEDPNARHVQEKREKLPSDLQKLVDNEDSFLDQLYEGTGGQSTDSNIRYAAYANRIRTIMLSAQRYVAYTSDIGESFRPVAHPYLIKTAYGVSIAYLIGDVANEGRKAWVRQNALMHPSNPGIVSRRATDASVVRDKNTEALIPAVPKAVHVPAINDWKAVMAQRAVFQALASMILPAFTIHSIVRYSGQAFKNVKSPKIRTWGPVGLGLAAVPALPYIFDHPVETAVEWTFHRVFEVLGGPGAIGHTSETGREAALQASNKKALKEKEL